MDLGSNVGSHRNVLKITNQYRKIHFATPDAKNKQWEALLICANDIRVPRLEPYEYTPKGRLNNTRFGAADWGFLRF